MSPSPLHISGQTSPQKARDWFEGLRRRRESALEAVVQTFGQGLSATAFALLADRSLAQDAVQETFIAAWDGARRARPQSQLRPWLYGILLNRCRKLQRSARRRRRHERARRTRAAPPAPDATSTDRLAEALDRLVEGQRAVIVLRFQQGLSVAETSAALEIPEGTVKSRCAAAIGKLRKELTGHA